jgi:hypothetical protein
MLNSSYINETSDWVESTIAQINAQLASVKSESDAKLAKRRVNLFIDEIQQKNREISLHMKEVRQKYDQEMPSRGYFSKRTRIDIDADRDKLLQPWAGVQVVLNNLITEMKRALYEIDKQMMEKADGDELSINSHAAKGSGNLGYAVNVEHPDNKLSARR